MTKNVVIAFPLSGEVKWMVVAKQVETTLDDVGDIAHICQWCHCQQSEALLEVTQHGLFGDSDIRTFMYCAACCRATVWHYVIDSNEEIGNENQ